MYITNERGLTLLEVLAALVLLAFTLTLGYKLLTTINGNTEKRTEEAQKLTQIDSYTKLFLQDIRQAKNVTYTEQDRKITLSYTGDKEKEITYTPGENNTYQVSYRDEYSYEDDWVEVTTAGGERPIYYNEEENSLLFNHTIGGVMSYTYKLYLWRNRDE